MGDVIAAILVVPFKETLPLGNRASPNQYEYKNASFCHGVSEKALVPLF
jgi:hypothetical protein